MLWAPVVGAGLGAVAAGALAVGGRVWPAPLAGAVAVLLLAGLTRGLHLDGLADTADGLGSSRGAAGALEVMKRSDIGPFGVAAVAGTLLLQTLAAGAAGPLGLAVAVTTGRLALLPAVARGVGPARPDGLGALVAGTVPRVAVAAAGGATVAAAFALLGARGGVAVVAGCAAGVVLVARCVRRLGGITGDVLGAAVETATTAALLVLAAT